MDVARLGWDHGDVAYDEDLAQRLRVLLADEDVVEKRMFGGLAFLLDGHLAVAVSGQGGLMLRCHPDDTEQLVAEPGAHPMEMRGRELRGWLRVEADALASDAQLRAWIGPALDWARSLEAAPSA